MVYCLTDTLIALRFRKTEVRKMNLTHMKYAVEIAETKSINKAAETLYVVQSALSRAVKELELFYKETNAMRAIKNILNDEFKLGIIRYAESFDKYYKDTLYEKGLNYELITKFRYMLLMNRESPLAQKEKITYDDLRNFDYDCPRRPTCSLPPLRQGKKEELTDNSDRRIFVFELASQFELLAENKETFMWVSPIPQSLLDRYGLVQCYCDENQRIYKDVLIHRKEYSLSELDNMFVSELIRAKKEIVGEM